MKRNKEIIIISLIFFLAIALSFNVSAYRKLCMTYGQSIPDDENPRYTCWHDLCQICVTDDNRPAAPYRCYGISGCEIFGEGDPELDVSPPNLTINSPENNKIYSSRSILFDLTSNEPVNGYYLDNINGRGSWRRLFSNKQSYSEERRLNEGFNSITIMAEDENDNSVEIERHFYIDSKKPKIKKTEPTRGFATGIFEVEFQEENPLSLILHYGNSIVGYRNKTKIFEENAADSCTPIRGNSNKQLCNFEVDLENYDGQQIEYWAFIEDIAQSTDESRHYWLEVDTTFPVLNNNPHFWSQGEGRYSRYVYFTFNITEENFDEIEYIDWTDNRPRWRRLCSRLDEDGICEKRKSFRRGFHSLDIQITDEAGNAISTPKVEFEVY